MRGKAKGKDAKLHSRSQSLGQAPYCITCKYLDKDKCTYFKRFRISEPKKIPWNIGKKGCKVYLPKWSKEHRLLDYILDLFK